MASCGLSGIDHRGNARLFPPNKQGKCVTGEKVEAQDFACVLPLRSRQRLSEVSRASAFEQLSLDHGCGLFLGYGAVFVGVEAGIAIVLSAWLAEENP
jgi:hypothetical protein